MCEPNDDLRIGTIHELLSERPRREVIYRLGRVSNEEELTVRRLAEEIASRNDGTAEEWYHKLRHRHLPVLKSNQAISWDENTDIVTEDEFTLTLFDYLTEVEEYGQ